MTRINWIDLIVWCTFRAAIIKNINNCCSYDYKKRHEISYCFCQTPKLAPWLKYKLQKWEGRQHYRVQTNINFERSCIYNHWKIHYKAFLQIRVTSLCVANGLAQEFRFWANECNHYFGHIFLKLLLVCKYIFYAQTFKHSNN